MTDINNITAEGVAQGLQNDIGFVLVARLNNVGVSSGWGGEDWVAGTTEIAGMNRINSTFDSDVIVSDHVVSGAGIDIEERAESDFQFKQAINARWDVEGNNISVSTFSIVNPKDNPIPNIYARQFDGFGYELKIGGRLNVGLKDDYTMSYSEYPTLIKGKFNAPRWDDERLTISSSLENRLLNKTITTNTYLGNGGAEGQSEIRGQVKPVLVGYGNNISPVDLGNGFYQWNDGVCMLLSGSGTEALELVEDVRNNGSSLTRQSNGSNGLVDDVFAESQPAEGQYIFDRNGYLYVGGDEDYRQTITMDCLGLNDSYSYLSLIGGAVSGGSVTVITATKNLFSSVLAVLSRALSDEDITVFRDSDNSYSDLIDALIDGGSTAEELSKQFFIHNYQLDDFEVGLYITDSMTARDFLNKILVPHNQYYRFGREGYLYMSKRKRLVNSNVSATIPEANVGSLVRLNSEPRYYRHDVRYSKNWTIQDRDILPSSRKRIDSREYVSESDTSLGSNLVGEALVREIESSLLDQVDAQTLAKEVSVSSSYQSRIECTLINEGWRHVAGDLVRIEYPTLIDGIIEIIEVVEDLDGETRMVGVHYG